MNTNKLDTKIPMKSGKVRDIYDLKDKLLIVTSDRISAFDYVCNSKIPDKGKILNQISKFWFKKTRDIIPNHFITDKIEDYPDILQNYRIQLEKRSMLVHKAEMIPFECIVRGYITGSGWRDYKETGKVCDIELPDNLKEAQKLEEPLFTPSTKAKVGEHDENIGFSRMKQELGSELAESIKRISLQLYNYAHDYLIDKGIIIADTKFEFGLYNDELILIDEALTPDSSRFWAKDAYEVGTSPKSFDKQFVRNYLLNAGIDEMEEVKEDSEILTLPQEIIKKTREKYLKAYKLITGKDEI